MFEIDVEGLRELEGARGPERLAMEPITNVFDEFRGYGTERKTPTFCAVTLEYSANPRGVWLVVADDGGGFTNPRDIWTLFGTTAKRADAGVAGRFNAGEKQLIAVARAAEIKTGTCHVSFADGKRETHRTREPFDGTTVRVLMPWNQSQMFGVETALRNVRAPHGLAYTVNGAAVPRSTARHGVTVSLPTVVLRDGVMSNTVRKCRVEIVDTADDAPATLYELGMPICALDDLAFPFSLDVDQKIPVPMSRDTVAPAYLYRLIGLCVEQSAMDGHRLLSDDQQNAPFLKMALDWVRDAGALANVVRDVYGDNVVRQTNNNVDNAAAAASGATLVSGSAFTPETRKRFETAGIMPTSSKRFGAAIDRAADEYAASRVCPACNGRGRIG